MKDFQNVFQRRSNSSILFSKQQVEHTTNEQIVNVNPSSSNLQKEYNYSLQKIEDLQNFNNSLSNQLKEYALMFTEEKKEKKEIQNKLETLNEKFHSQAEKYSREKILFFRKYYTLFGVLFFFGLIILRLILP